MFLQPRKSIALVIGTGLGLIERPILDTLDVLGVPENDVHGARKKIPGKSARRLESNFRYEMLCAKDFIQQ